MWQKFMLLSLTPIILHLTCQPRCVKTLWKNYLWQWPEARIELCFVSTCHQTCMDVCRDESLQPVGECRGVYGRFVSALSSKSENLLCVSILRCSRVTEAFWSSQVCTSPVTLAEWQKGANGCCYARLPEHLLRVTLFFHCHLTPSDSAGMSALLFLFLPPNPAPDRCHFSPWADKWFMLLKVWIVAF